MTVHARALNPTAHWVFVRGDIASVTVSGAEDSLADAPAEDLAARLWHDTARALDRGGCTIPPSRILKERRTTFPQTPDNHRRRPGTRTGWENVLLAGDWTDTGLSGDDRGALRSGQAAARAVIG